MNFEKFSSFALDYNLIPVYEVITADLLTPVLAYLKIRETGKNSFLLESVEGSLNLARYSFIGKNPCTVISNKGVSLDVYKDDKHFESTGNIFDFISSEVNKYKQPKLAELPDFTGGLVGYIGYENMAQIESVIKFNSPATDSPDSILGMYKTLLAFDHYKHQIILISNVYLGDFNSLEDAFAKAKADLAELRKELKIPVSHLSDFELPKGASNEFDSTALQIAINSAKQNIIEGDIFQIVLSKRFSTQYSGDLINVYRALRIINPSPYMYHLEFGNGFTVIGTSPEDLLKVKNGKAQLLPIAGTRKRGSTVEKDNALEKDLMNDPKELAEHTMLVDLGRNDLGRVCKYGSVKVTELMRIQKYSHVMHIVSKVEGDLRDDLTAIDAFKACFPAGTVSGAPKIRAIQLIDEYEKSERNVYSGAVGYFDFSGNLDTCIAIRTLFAKDGVVSWQAGAGIVADSRPELECLEIQNKAAVIVNALKYAEVIDEDISN